MKAGPSGCSVGESELSSRGLYFRVPKEIFGAEGPSPYFLFLMTEAIFRTTAN